MPLERCGSEIIQFVKMLIWAQMPMQMLGRPILRKQVCLDSFFYSDLANRSRRRTTASTAPQPPCSQTHWPTYLSQQPEFSFSTSLSTSFQTFLVQLEDFSRSTCSTTSRISPCKVSLEPLEFSARISIAHSGWRLASFPTWFNIPDMSSPFLKWNDGCFGLYVGLIKFWLILTSGSSTT